MALVKLHEIDKPDWFEGMSPEQAKFYEDMGYGALCKMHGKIVGLYQFIYTVGIVVGMDESGYEYRFCYEDVDAALSALVGWIISGEEEPSGYIKRKPEAHT